MSVQAALFAETSGLPTDRTGASSWSRLCLRPGCQSTEQQDLIAVDLELAGQAVVGVGAVRCQASNTPCRSSRPGQVAVT